MLYVPSRPTCARIQLINLPKNFKSLLIGNASAQIILALASIVLARIYSMAEFGVFGAAVAVCIVGSQLATLSLENSLSLEGSLESKYVGIHIILLSSLITSMTLFILLSLLSNVVLVEIKFSTIETALISICLFFYSIQKALVQYNISIDGFSQISKSRFFQAISTVLIQFLLSFSDYGLLVGYFFGLLIACIALAPCSGFFTNCCNIGAMFSFVCKHYRFLKFQLPASALAAFSSNMIYFILGLKFSASFIGAYALSNRVISTPLTYITTSLGQFYFSEITRPASDISNTTLKICKKSWAFTLPVFGIFPFVSDYIFIYAFGDSWLLSSEISILLSPMFAISFVISPLSYVFSATHTQKYDLLLTIIFLVFRTSGLAIGIYHNDPIIGILFFSFLSSVAYVIYGVFIFKVSKLNFIDSLIFVILPAIGIWLASAISRPDLLLKAFS